MMLNLCKQFQCHEISSKTQKWRRPEIGLEFSGVSSNVAHPKNAQKIKQKHLPSSLKLINSSKVRLLLLTDVSTVLLENIFHIFLANLKRVHFAPRKKLENRAKITFHQNCVAGIKL